MIGILYPQFLLYAVAASVLLVIILKLDFLRSKDDDFRRSDRRKTKTIVLFSRILIVLFLFLALATPYTELEVEERGPPKLRMIIDRSSSMDLMDADLDAIQDYLEARVPTTISYMGRNTTSNLGDGILTNLEEESNILLITDGYSNRGIPMGDIMVEAAAINATISALVLEPKHSDSSVIIIGDEKSFADVEYNFEVLIQRTDQFSTSVRVAIDDRVIFEESTSENRLAFTEQFSPGIHKISAKIGDDDYFEQNNNFFKSVRVIDKPKILYVSEKTDPIEKILDSLYDYEKRSTIPADLDPYYAIIIDDVPASKLNDDTLLLTSYLMEGNGILSIGGFNSYDRGKYKNSLFETLLPVRVGSAEKKKGDANIIVVIDISGASTLSFQGKTISPLDVTKALALEVVGTLNRANKVGVVAFNDKPYKVVDIAPLYDNKPIIDDKVKRLVGGGQSYFDQGLKGAYELLKNQKGDRNVILLTDGLAFKDVQDRTSSVADSLYALGIKTYVVGVGRAVEHDFLLDLALRGGGIYFPASESNKLAILFGDPEEIKEGEDFGLFVLNPNHFITKGIYTSAMMSGFNEVVPKSAARTLVTTSDGQPALTVWNYGVGRVASITVFTGGNLGHLLTENNSAIISKTINWLISDPERKAAYFVDVNDGFIDRPFKVRVKSEKRPTAEGFDFHKVERGIYESEEFMVEDPGFRSILNTTFAANSEKEYTFIGFNQDLEYLVESTGGKLFKDVEDIPEFVKNASRTRELRKVYLIWPAILMALLIFLIEVWIRKRNENLKEKKVKKSG
ncbi:MAG: VWA domain-containing protein [Nanoarchaeota archaeon]|nr:VWA domain-containing protein [Nanoarchaeota archaeon]